MPSANGFQAGRPSLSAIPAEATLTKRDSRRSDPHQARFPPKRPPPSAIPDGSAEIQLRVAALGEKRAS